MIPHTKFWIALAITVLAFVGLLLGRISGAEFATITISVSTIYSGANIGATYAHRTGD